MGDPLRRRRLVSGAIAVYAALTGSSIFGWSPQDAGLSPSTFIKAYQTAHEHHDAEAMSKLYCWDGVTADVRASAGSHFFDEPIVDIKLVNEPAPGRIKAYVKNGVAYRFNLPVVSELVVKHPPLSKAADNASYYPVGIKDGRYLIAVMAPKPPAAQDSPHVIPERPAQPTGAIAAPRQIRSVPENTVLIVRLQDTVGTTLLKTGGAFRATLAKVVEIGGTIVIPVGAPVRGAVTQQGAYSPQMTLQSITVNRIPRRLYTSSVTFGEAIGFPVGSDLSFKVIRVVDLENSR
jgi:hypothetical protein